MNKRAPERSSEKPSKSQDPNFFGSDFAKMDAYVNTAEDYEEIPELTDEMLQQGTFMINGVPADAPPCSRKTKSPRKT